MSTALMAQSLRSINAMSILPEQSGGMPYVRFERIAVEDPKASIEAGHYVARDIDYVKITPPYSKDIFTTKVTSWQAQLKVDADNGRIPYDWIQKYNAAYEAWKSGQEIPLDGIPIKGWGVCSPAQQETLIRMHILTVEQLAAVTHEGLTRIGMGGVDLKNKAEAWLKSLKKSGSVSVEIAALKKENTSLNHSVSSLMSRIEELTALVNSQSTQPETMTLSDIMDY
jgi:hypothetical protein